MELEKGGGLDAYRKTCFVPNFSTFRIIDLITGTVAVAAVVATGATDISDIFWRS